MELKKEPVPVKKKSISELAGITTLSEDELNEANSSEEEYYEDDNAEYPKEQETEDDNSGEDYEDRETEEEEQEPKEPEVERMVHTDPKLCLVARPTAKDIYRFMFRHTYLSPVGIFALLLGIGALGFGIKNCINGQIWPNGILCFGVFFLFAINSPLSLIRRAKKQAEEINSDEGRITYTLSPAGIDLTRGEEYAKYEWSNVLKVVTGKTGYYVYLGKNRVFIAPKADLLENEAVFLRLVEENVKK